MGQTGDEMGRGPGSPMHPAADQSASAVAGDALAEDAVEGPDAQRDVDPEVPSGANQGMRPDASARSDRWRAGLRAASAIVLGSIALGAVLGAVWVIFAPRVDAVAKGGQPVPVTESPEQYAAADALFIVLFAAAGVLVAIIAARTFRASPWGVLAGVVIGGLIGSVVAAGLGGWLGWTDPQAQARAATDGAAIVASAELRTPTALLIWAFLGALTLFFGALFGPGRRRSRG